jgi:hypothetical protein
MMQKELTPLDGLILLRPRIFTDDRGHFFESFNSRAFKELSGITADFVQDNESMSIKDVLRGLHFQEEPFAQGKLVRVVQGAVVDVCVDIRPSSPTYGQHFKVRLDATEKAMLWIPPDSHMDSSPWRKALHSPTSVPRIITLPPNVPCCGTMPIWVSTGALQTRSSARRTRKEWPSRR